MPNEGADFANILHAIAAAGRDHIAHALQAFGLLSVVFTAIGCQYFVFHAETNVASRAGLGAVGILLVLLNAVFVLVMLLLIGRAAKEEGAVVLKRVLNRVQLAGQTCWMKVRSWQHTNPLGSDGVALTNQASHSTSAAVVGPPHSE